MSRVKLGDVAREYKATVKDASGLPIVGLEHLTPGEITLDRWDEGTENTFTKEFKKGQMLFGRRRAYLKKAALAPFDGVCSGDITVIEAIPGKILPDLLPFIIQNDLLFDYAVGKSAGSLSPRVKWIDLKDYEFELPEISKQAPMVELLQAAHAARKAYKELIQATDDLVKSQFIEMFGDPVSNSAGRQQLPFSKFMTGIRYGTSQPPVFSETGEYKFIRATNIKNGRICEKDMLRIDASEAAKIEKCKLEGNEIIIVRSGANTGDTCIVTGDYAGHYAGYDIIISLDLEIANPVFFNELLNTDYMQMVVKPLTARSAQPHINAQQVSNLPMLVATLAEQEQFAELVEQSDKSQFIEMFGSPVTIDKKWPVMTVGDVSTSQLGKMLNAKNQTGKEQHLYLANRNVQWFSLDLTDLRMMDFNEAEREKYKLEIDDLLVCEGGEIGRCAIWHGEIEDCYIQNAVHRVRCNRELISPLFLGQLLYYHAQENGFSDIVGSKATIAHLPADKLKAMKIPVPPLHLQNEFEQIVKQSDKSKLTIENNTNNQEEAECLQKLILKKWSVRP